MSGDPGHVHLAGAVLNEELHVQAAQQHGVTVEEIRRQDRLGLGIQERPSGLPSPSWCRMDARVLEDLPTVDGELMSRAGRLSVDAPAPPARVVPGHLQHQRPHGRHGPRAVRENGADSPSAARRGRRASAAGSEER
jgi:hypothetical protein